MYTLGHTASGFLAGTIFGGGRKLNPTSLACIFLFASAIDIAHYKILRTATHSLLFFALLIPALLWFAERRGWMRREERLIMFVAAASHILCDYLFGRFTFLFPFSMKEFGLLAWGSYLDFTIEMTLFAAFLVVFLAQRPWREAPRTRRFHRVVFGAVGLAGFMGASIIVYNDFFRGPNLYDGTIYNDGSKLWLSGIFLAVQLTFCGLMAFLCFKVPRLKESER